MTEPVTLAEAKEFCRVDTDDTTQDVTINMLIAAARERAEHLTGRTFSTRNRDFFADDLTGEWIELPYPPLISVSSVRYLDSSGVERIMSGSPDQWRIDVATTPGRIAPLYGASWPATDGSASNVHITYSSGYDADEIPASLKIWMQLRISTFYDNRANIVVGDRLTELSDDYVDRLLDSLKADLGFA